MDLSISYLKYLREVSRKIVLTGGFERVFPGTKRDPECISLLSESRDQAWFRHASSQSERADRQSFIGIGSLAGTVSARSKAKKLAGPLFFAQVVIDPEGPSVTVINKTLTINHDLIQHLVDIGILGTAEDEGSALSTDYQALLSLLDEVGRLLVDLPIPEVITQMPLGASRDEIRISIRKLIDGVSGINHKLHLKWAPSCESAKELVDRSRSRELTWTDDVFLFTAKFPDQLSTHTALEQLIGEIENGAAENPLIEDMLRAALEDKELLESEATEEVHESIRAALKYLPLTLSPRQKKAVYDALEHRVSYVQGPPGTGKSYTIAAIMLTAAIMGKKSLLVSQKKAAINVVREKLSALCGGDDSLVFISKDPTVKNEIKLKLDGFIHASDADRTNRSHALEAERNTQMKRQIDALREEAKDTRSKIKAMMESQREFFQANSEFLRLRDNLVTTFGFSRDSSLIELSEENSLLLERRLKLIGQLRLKPRLLRRDVLVLKATAKAVQNLMGVEPTELDITSPKFELYLGDLRAASLAFNRASIAQGKCVSAKDINTFRLGYANQLRNLEVSQRRYIGSLLTLQRLKYLRTTEQRSHLKLFRSMLHNVNANLIAPKMDGCDYDQLTSMMPMWSGLIRDLGSYLPLQSQLFDLILVDESSQVNIAEVIPAFYRAKHLCVVGDKKQLGLNAAGLFSLNRQFEIMAWNSSFSGKYPFAQAGDRGLAVSTHSILEFITNPNGKIQPPSSTLNEHFRSGPKLAQFTSQAFYAEEGGLNVMTLVGEKAARPCFEAIQVGGSREEKFRVVLTEVEKAMEMLRNLMLNESWKTDFQIRDHFQENIKPSIGVLCFTTHQCAEMRERITEFGEDKCVEYSLFVGTTEEFQGNERNIMFLLPAVDEFLTSAQFYNDARRMNVATSRAINFTYLIYGSLPANFQRLHSYLRHFDVSPEDFSRPLRLVDRYYNWKFDKAKLESEFEKRVHPFLEHFLSTDFPSRKLHIFNQVQSCGKFLDFVVFNPATTRAFAVEVDGPDHYRESTHNFTDTHLERDALLKRAGWDILHIPHYRWYYRGWLADTNVPVFDRFATSLQKELRTYVDRIC